MENGNRNKDIQEKKTLANYKNIDITDIIYYVRTLYIDIPSRWIDDFNIISHCRYSLQENPDCIKNDYKEKVIIPILSE